MSRTDLEEEDDEEEEFCVFVSHGRSELWRDVERYINKRLDFETVVLKETYHGGTIIEKLEDGADLCHCAVVVMTPDDEQADGNFRARQNVIHEIGYFQDLYGRENVIILKEKSVESFSNNAGIEYVGFSGNQINATFDALAEGLESIFATWRDEDEDDEDESDEK